MPGLDEDHLSDLYDTMPPTNIDAEGNNDMLSKKAKDNQGM